MVLGIIPNTKFVYSLKEEPPNIYLEVLLFSHIEVSHFKVLMFLDKYVILSGITKETVLQILLFYNRCYLFAPICR